MMKYPHPSDVRWLLIRINNINENFSKNYPKPTFSNLNKAATYRNIWAGSYDVISCPQDEVDAIVIPKARMKQAGDDGLIFSQTITSGKYTYEIWHLTDLGKSMI